MKEKICGIYCIINLINGKMYIGQSADIECRWSRHKCLLKNNKHGRHGNSKSKNIDYLQCAWNKYGEENFKFEILKIFKKKKDVNRINLTKWEKYYIYKYMTFNPNCGYNNTPGGEGFSLSEETKAKISKANLGNKYNLGKKHTKETKEKLRKANLGKKASKEAKEKMSKIHLGNKHNLGKKQSEETKEKHRIASSGRKHTEETREKLRKKLLGHEVSEKTIEKIRIANTGKKHSDEQNQKTKIANTGKKRSEESKERMKQAWIKRKEILSKKEPCR